MRDDGQRAIIVHSVVSIDKGKSATTGTSSANSVDIDLSGAGENFHVAMHHNTVVRSATLHQQVSAAGEETHIPFKLY